MKLLKKKKSRNRIRRKKGEKSVSSDLSLVELISSLCRGFCINSHGRCSHKSLRHEFLPG
jgi:hypothetical protein